VLLSALAGCGSHIAPRLSDSLGERLVLQPADMPGFQQFDSGRQRRSDAYSGPRKDPARFGRQDGWKARYRRGGGPTTRGPLVVDSRVDVFGDMQGAKRDLAAYEADYEQQAKTVGARSVAVPRIGDDTRAWLIKQGAVRNGVETFAVAWRDGRTTASITANGFTRGLRLTDIVALARKQQNHLAASR